MHAARRSETGQDTLSVNMMQLDTDTSALLNLVTSHEASQCYATFSAWSHASTAANVMQESCVLLF